MPAIPEAALLFLKEERQSTMVAGVDATQFEVLLQYWGAVLRAADVPALPSEYAALLDDSSHQYTAAPTAAVVRPVVLFWASYRFLMGLTFTNALSDTVAAS